MAGPIQRSIRAVFDDIIEEGVKLRAGRPYLGREALLAQDPFEPTPIEHTPAPLAHWSDPEAFVEYFAGNRNFRTLHTRASASRHDDSPLPYPPYGFPAAAPFESGE